MNALAQALPGGQQAELQGNQGLTPTLQLLVELRPGGTQQSVRVHDQSTVCQSMWHRQSEYMIHGSQSTRQQSSSSARYNEVRVPVSMRSTPHSCYIAHGISVN